MGLKTKVTGALVSNLFREISLIDAENIPSDRGSIIVSWHPGGMFDELLTKNLLPINLISVDVNNIDEQKLMEIAQMVSSGGSVVVFPEGVSHDLPKSIEIKDTAAKIAIKAAEICTGKKPVIIALGIHYSNKNMFRERVAVTVERPIELEGDVEHLSMIISGEISRASQSQDNWKDRELIWKARSIVKAERQRMSKISNQKPTYGEDILGARRVRAAWEWLAMNNEKECQRLERKTREHMAMLEYYNLRPYDVDSRPMSVTNLGFAKSIFLWLYAWSFMLGFVTLSALIGSLPPFLFVVFSDKYLWSNLDQSSRSKFKLYSVFISYPIWWVISATGFTWALLSSDSPLAGLADYSVTIEFLFSLPSFAVFPIMLWWMPTSAKLQVALYSRGTKSWKRMRLWMKWRSSKFDWSSISESQQNLAKELVNIGDKLVLPGDEDWVEPLPGKDDISVIQQR